MIEQFSSLTGFVRDDLRRAWGTLVVFEVLFKLVEAWLIAPVGALALSARRVKAALAGS